MRLVAVGVWLRFILVTAHISMRRVLTKLSFEVAESRVGVLGASSLVGGCVLPVLGDAGWQVVAFSRKTVENGFGVEWRRLPFIESIEQIPHWICVAPIWVLPNYFALIEASGGRRVVVLSSTSRFTKVGSGRYGRSCLGSKVDRQ